MGLFVLEENNYYLQIGGAPSVEILIKRLAEFHLSVTTPLFPNDKTALQQNKFCSNGVTSSGSLSGQAQLIVFLTLAFWYPAEVVRWGWN